MKKTLLLVALMAMFMSANAQWFDFSNNNERISIGFNLGQVGTGTYYKDLGFGASVEILGVYFDYIGAGPAHKYDNHLNQTWEDSLSWAAHIGYQIPVLPWLRVMPMIGYSQTNHGITDGSTLNIENNDNGNNRLYHDYYVAAGSRRHSFNFGCGLVITPLKYFSVYGVYTRRAIYGGISINLAAFGD